MPLLATAHSAHDQRRDLGAFGDLAFGVAPERNPFRSRRVLADPGDPAHLTQANFGAFVAVPGGSP